MEQNNQNLGQEKVIEEQEEIFAPEKNAFDTTPKDTASPKAETEQDELVEAKPSVEDRVEIPSEAAINPAESEKKPVSPKPRTNFKQNYPFATDSESDWSNDELTFELPSDRTSIIQEKVEGIPDGSIFNSPEGIAYLQNINYAARYSGDDVLEQALDKPTSDYRQTIDINGKELCGGSPKLRTREDGIYQGENAVIRLMSHMGIGRLFQVPLWHSGFWLTLRPPYESDFISLHQQLTADKISFGRETYGATYTTVGAFTVNRIVDFILDHVYDCTVKKSEMSIAQMKDFIAIQDIYPLIWGFMSTIYTKGFQFSRACTANPEKCQHVSQEKLTLNRLIWTDSNGLTEWQKIHMTQRQSQTKDKASILKYREEFTNNKPTRFPLIERENGPVSVTFKIGNITEYIDAGYEWINGVVDSIEQVAATKNSTVEEKERLIAKLQNSTVLRQTTHQVESIEFGSGTVNDPDTIKRSLNALSAEYDFVTKYLEALSTFNSKATVAVVGMPTYDCPKCGGEQKGMADNDNFTNIIPLDAVQLFFDLVSYRSARQ